MSTAQNCDETCCPKFDPAPWDDQVISWNQKYFIKENSRTIFYMPLNFSKTIISLFAQAEQAGATNHDGICLSEHTSMWNMVLWLSTDKEVPGVDSGTLSGDYYCKVYEGSYNQMSKWEKDFDQLGKSKGYVFGKHFVWYTTCPKCAKKYGKNYVVLMSEIKKA
jgi:hypothetical protein